MCFFYEAYYVNNAFFKLTVKKSLIYCCLIQLFFLTLILLFDQRSFAITLPSSLLRAISISISYLVYNIDGYVGLVQVYNTINEILSVPWRNEIPTSFFLDNYTQYKEINLLINEKIIEAKQIVSPNKDILHGYFNDIGFVYYVIIAFKIFGFKIQSLSFLFSFLIIFPSFLLLISLHDNKNALYLLVCFLSAIIFAVYFSFGEDKNLGAVYNPRFLPILSLIPFTNIIFLLTRMKKIEIINFIIISLQTSILFFAILLRSSTLWIIVSFFLFLLFYVYSSRFKIKKKNPNKLFAILIIPIILIFSTQFASSYFEKKSHKIYKHDVMKVKHDIWHSSLTGFLGDKKLWLKHVCFDPPSKENLQNFKHLSCDDVNTIFPRHSRFLNYILTSNFKDDYVAHSAIKFLNDRKMSISIIGPTNYLLDKNLKNFPIEAKTHVFYYRSYEKILKSVLFNIIRTDPLDILITQFFYKPSKYFYELAQSPFYFIRSIFRSKIPFLTVLVILIILLNLFYSAKIHAKETSQKKISINDEKIISWLIIASLFLSSSLINFIFYSMPHVIVASLTVIGVAFSFAIIELTRLINNRLT